MKKLRVLLIAILACICLYSLYACSITGGKIPEASEYALSVNHTKDDPNREWAQMGNEFNTPVRSLTIKSPGKEDRVYTAGEYGSSISDFTGQSIRVGDKVLLTVYNFYNEDYQENSNYQRIDTYRWYLTKINVNDVDIPILESNTGEFSFSFEVFEQDYSVFLTYEKEEIVPDLPKSGVLTVQENHISGNDIRGNVTAKIIKRAQFDQDGYFVTDSNRLPLLETLSNPINVVFGETEIKEGDVIEYRVIPNNGYFLNRIVYNGTTTRTNENTGIISIAQRTGAIGRVSNAVLVQAQEVNVNNAVFVAQVGSDMPIFGVRFTEGSINVNPVNVITWIIDEYNETSSEVNDGEIPVYPESEVPTKASDNDYAYKFIGWSTDPNATEPETLSAVTEDTTYYAVFEQVSKLVKANFYNGSSKIQGGDVERGTEPVFLGTNPTKTSTSQYSYNFIGWSTDPNATEPDDSLIASEDVNDFYAVFEQVDRLYTISWMVDNTLYETAQISYNATPVKPAINPTKNSDDFDYQFLGWSATKDGDIINEFSAVTGDSSITTFYAIFASSVDGIVLDGQKDNGYGSYNTWVELSNGGNYTVSAIKNSKGVVIYSQAKFNTSVSNADWGSATNFEFKLNGASGQSYVAVGNLASTNVLKYVLKVEQVSGKYVHTIEFFVPKVNIEGWTDNGDIQLNYAWKSPNDASTIISGTINKEHLGWNDPWHAWHRIGGLEATWGMPANLFITSNGLTTIKAPSTAGAPTLDGEITAGEYGTYANLELTNSSSTSVIVNGKVVDGDLYFAMTINHGAWATYSSDWWLNDNFELVINGNQAHNTNTILTLVNGNLNVFTSGIDEAISKTITNSSTSQVTVIEFYVQGSCDIYSVEVGMNGNGFTGGQWVTLAMGDSAVYVQSNGVTLSNNKPTTLANGITLDGKLDDSVYTSTVLANAITDTVNNATVTAVATIVSNGIVVGVTVNHANALTVPGNNGSGSWWHYLNVEFRLNNVAKQVYGSVHNSSSNTYFAYSSSGSDGNYTTVFEFFINASQYNGIAGAETAIAIGGVYEGGFGRLTGDWNDDTGFVYSLYKITSNGIVLI